MLNHTPAISSWERVRKAQESTTDQQWHPFPAPAGYPMPHKGFRTSTHSTAKLMYIYHQGGQEAVGQTQPHIPLLHPRPFCFLSKPMAFAPLLCAPWQGHLEFCPVAWRCIQPRNGVMTTGPQDKVWELQKVPNSSPHPNPQTTSLQHRRGNDLGCRTPNLGALSIPAELEQSRSSSASPTEPDTGRSERAARLHASAAAATARLNRKSEAKNCISSAR